MAPPARTDFRNAILASLSAPDAALLTEYLEPRPLRLRQRIEPANRKIRNVYFIEQGMASVMAISGSGRRQAEVGVIGVEGMTGIAAVLGAQKTPHETFMQGAGRGFCITADRLRSLMARSRTLADALCRYAHSFNVQTAQTALVNALGSIEERVARRLLLTHDRLQQAELRLTHDYLALTIGVRRPGVTLALQRLERQCLVETGRGTIKIVNREGLIQCARGFYGVPEAETARLFG